MAFYHPLTLGVPRSRPSEPSKAPPKRPSADLSYEMWREGLARLDISYDEYPEARVLEVVRRAAAYAGRRLWLILGEPGAGKSTLLRAWFERWARTLPEPHLGLPVPVLVSLRELEPGDLAGDREALADRLWSSALGSSAPLDHKGLEQIYHPSRGRLFWPVWLLDGLDEVQAGLLANEKLYQRLVELPGHKVVSCRTAVYQTLQRKAERNVEQEYEVLGLKPGEQITFLEAALGGNRAQAEALYRRVHDNAALRPLASNPFLLSLIAEEPNQLQLPATRAALYRQAAEKIWYDKLSDTGAGELSEVLDWRTERDQVLIELARQMGLDLKKAETDWQLVIQVTETVAGKRAGPLRRALERAGLLRVNERQATFSFVQLTFQEFYLAQALKPAGLRMALQQYWHDPRYEETLGLLISMLFEDGYLEEIEQEICWFIRWGQQVHQNNPHILYQKQRSPLRIALHLLQRAGVQIKRLVKMEDLLRKKIDSFSILKQVLVFDEKTPPYFLNQLARDPDKDVRRGAAFNPNMPPETLAQLARDPDKDVRRGAAGNPNTPPKALAQLVSDTARNLNTPPKTLDQFVRDPDRDVRRGAARNPNTPPEALAHLISDPDIGVRVWAAGNRNTPPKALAQLARDPDRDVRWGAARNPKLFLEDIKNASLIQIWSDYFRNTLLRA